MRFNVKRIGIAIAAVALLGTAAGFASPLPRQAATPTEAQLDLDVYRQLMDLPFFTVFDNLQYRINGTEVTLYGQTANPTLMHDARNLVARIPGITKVNTEIELLPQSQFDNRIRHAEFHVIYGAPSLQKYGEGNYPSIHIIVKNGHVKLVGTVDNEFDRQIAETMALQVRYVFSVENELIVMPPTS